MDPVADWPATIVDGVTMHSEISGGESAQSRSGAGSVVGGATWVVGGATWVVGGAGDEVAVVAVGICEPATMSKFSVASCWVPFSATTRTLSV